MSAMNPQQLISGLEDISDERIPVSCIYDMIPEIIEYLKVVSETDNNQDEQHRQHTV